MPLVLARCDNSLCQHCCGCGLGSGSAERCRTGGSPRSLPAPPARLPYVPHVPRTALLGKVTASTFALERPRCVFDGHADASDAVWLAVAFANGERSLLQHVPPGAGDMGGPSPQSLTRHLCRAASAAFRNPLSRADVPRYKQLPTARSYMTLETAAAAYSCSAPSPAVLRVGDDTACRDQGRQDPCNGPLPSPGPYR